MVDIWNGTKFIPFMLLLLVKAEMRREDLEKEDLGCISIL
jgi:hypothetical protein